MRPSSSRWSEMPFVHEVNDIDALANYRADWERLLAETPRASFFQTLDWLLVYWRHFGQEQILRALVIEDRGEVLAFVPFVECVEATRAGRVRLLTYPLHDWGAFYSPIARDQAAALEAATRHLRAMRRTWDLIDLRWIDRTHVDGGATLAAMRGAGFTADERPWQQAATIDTSSSWGDYWRSRDARMRGNVGRCQRRLTERGEVRLVRHRTSPADGRIDPRWDLYDTCERLARSSWQGSSTTGTTLSHDAIRHFLRDAHAAAARSGGVDMNLLYVGDHPAAFAYNYVHNGHVSGLRTGFVAEYDGAGSVLLAKAIEDSFARGDRLYDLGTGYLEGKRHLLTELVTTHRVSHYPVLSAKARLLRWKRQIAGWWNDRRA